MLGLSFFRVLLLTAGIDLAKKPVAAIAKLFFRNNLRFIIAPYKKTL
jgi:hypothetical protein